MKIGENMYCPVCQSIEVTKAFDAVSTHGKTTLSKKERFAYYKCSQCSSLFLYGVKLNDRYYKKYYSFEGYQHEKTGIVGVLEKFLENQSSEMKLRYIRKHKNLKRKMRILDVGCGNGAFLASLDQTKFEAVGLELNPEEYASAKKKGLKVIKDDILHSRKRIGTFDVITLWHVVEHIPDPHRLFIQLKKHLKQGGIIIFSTPNSNSWGRNIGKEKWFHLDAPRHVILFDQKGIRHIAKETNLCLRKSYSHTFEFPLDLFWSLPSHIRYFVLPFYPIVKILAQETKTYILTA